MRESTPVLPVAPYVGGKKNLARRICERIEAIPHKAYAEPFVGMGGVFFRRRLAPKVEVINDLNREVATLFRILQRHYVPFMEMMRFQLTTRADSGAACSTRPIRWGFRPLPTIKARGRPVRPMAWATS